MVDSSIIAPPIPIPDFTNRSLEVIRLLVQEKEELEKMKVESENKLGGLLKENTNLIEELNPLQKNKSFDRRR